MNSIPHIPETAPFTLEQRAWLNGFLAGLFSQDPAGSPATQVNGAATLADKPSVPAEPMLVLYGSQTGTAEGLARKLAKESEGRGFAPVVHAMNDCEQARLAGANKVIIVSSTWGDGEPPDNATRFWDWIKADSAPRLEHLQFAVLGLGDRNYGNFCGASKKVDERLEALGARRLAPRGECDVDYEPTAKAWIDGLWGKLNGANVNGHVNGVVKNGVYALQPVNGSHNSGPAVLPGYDRSNAFPARLLRNVLLNKPSSAKEVRHFEISLGGSGLTYNVGDALGVVPENCPELVAEVIAALGASGDEPVKAESSIVPLHMALAQHLELGRPTTELLAEVARRAPDSELAALLSPERADELKKWLHGRDVLDVLRLTSAPLGITELVPLLRKLSSRLYSISSSPKAHPGEVHLTVGAVRYDSQGRNRKGVASTFLADRGGIAFVKVFVNPSHGFRPPTNSDVPMIMVGPGTGIAPFRAFLEEREAAGAKGTNWLFFGDQRRDTDFLYEEQLEAWQKSGLLTRLHLAFSRDQAEKIYVQHLMLEQAAELWAWLEAGAHFYVCGDAGRMAKDVDTALHEVIQKAGARTADDARAYVEKMKSDKRYQRDVY